MSRLLIIDIEMENAAFGPDEEGARLEVVSILEELVESFRQGKVPIYADTVLGLRDSNGNRVGKVQVVTD